jgi:hypothetical protein
LGLLALGRQSIWGLGLTLHKGRRRAGPDRRGDRMNLFRVNRLDLHACGCRVLADDLGAQGL